MSDKQPLNEAYKNEVLEAYQKISDTFNDYTWLMRKRVPYEEWPAHCKIAGVSEDLMGKSFHADPDNSVFNPKPPNIEESFKADIAKHSKDVMDSLDRAIRKGWHHLQPDCRPDQSFRAMVGIMQEWKKYIEGKEKKNNQFNLIRFKILDMLKDFNPHVNYQCRLLHDNLWDLYRMIPLKEEECAE